MKKIFYFKRFLRTISIMGYSRLQQALLLRIGLNLSKIICKSLELVSLSVPSNLIRFLPKSWCALLASCTEFISKDELRIFLYANRAYESSFSGHQKASLFIRLNFMFKNKSDLDFNNFVDLEILGKNAPKQNLDYFLVWSFHNNSNQGHSRILLSTISKLVQLKSPESELNVRYLPEHTTNMGHLGYLFLYANYYRNFDKDREIVLWPDISPNKYYLNQLLKILPFKIKLLPGSPADYQLERSQIDTLQYSRKKNATWRLEASCAIPTPQVFPEYIIKEDFCLNGDKNYSEEAVHNLASIGFKKEKWFVVLHVKENKLGYHEGGETRDSSVESFKLACKLIVDLGGQVVRMGGNNFPKLSENFQAIDYANSDVKSEILDYWLWANCKFWLGNSNGASVAVLPFGKPRLLVDLWPIHVFGPPNNLYLPKILVRNTDSSVVFPSELVTMKVSRTMKSELVKSSGLNLIDSSPELIKNSVLEFYDALAKQAKEPSGIFSNFEKDLVYSMQQSIDNDIMRIPQCFEKYLNNLLRT